MRYLGILMFMVLLTGCGRGGIPGGGRTICQEQCMTPSMCTITIYQASLLCPPGSITMTDSDLKRTLYPSSQESENE